MKPNKTLGTRARKEAILSMIAQKPCSIQQIMHALSTQSYDVVKILSEMVRSGQVTVKSLDEGLFVTSNRALNK